MFFSTILYAATPTFTHITMEQAPAWSNTELANLNSIYIQPLQDPINDTDRTGTKFLQKRTRIFSTLLYQI